MARFYIIGLEVKGASGSPLLADFDSRLLLEVELGQLHQCIAMAAKMVEGGCALFIVQPTVLWHQKRAHTIRWASASDALDGVKTKPIKGRKNERGDSRSRGMY